MGYDSIPSELRASGIYSIRNKINNKAYIGSSKYIGKRWINHTTLLKNNRHPNRYLQAAWNKYGGDWNFEIVILEVVNDLLTLVDREQYYLDLLKPEYNLRPLANSMVGFKHSDQTIAKMIAGKLAGKGFKHTEETKAKMRQQKPYMSIRMKGNKYREGYKYSEEDKIRLRLQPRKLDKWPHELGSKCRCEECLVKLREYHRNIKRNKKNAK